MTLELIEAHYVLGQILSDELPTVACDLIVAGIDSKSLAKLAGLSTNDDREAKELFEIALCELGREKMPKDLALNIL